MKEGKDRTARALKATLSSKDDFGELMEVNLPCRRRCGAGNKGQMLGGKACFQAIHFDL
jgi:hypothetical protein